MDLDDKTKFERAVEKRQLLISQNNGSTEMWRLVNGDGDGFAGFTLDIIGEAMVVEQHREDVDGISFLKMVREKFPQTPIFHKERWSGESKKRVGGFLDNITCETHFWAKEDDVFFDIDLTGDEHVGIFLDSSVARGEIKKVSLEKNVLNLFSYTGGFGMFAAKGGARSTVNIDNKNSAIKRCKQNYLKNGLEFDTRTFFKCDVIKYLKRAAKQKGRFDVVILDPPPRFKVSSGGEFVAHRDYAKLLSMAMKVTNNGGTIFAGLNSLKATNDTMVNAINHVREIENVDLIQGVVTGLRDDFPPCSDRPMGKFYKLKKGL